MVIDWIGHFWFSLVVRWNWTKQALYPSLHCEERELKRTFFCTFIVTMFMDGHDMGVPPCVLGQMRGASTFSTSLSSHTRTIAVSL